MNIYQRAHFILLSKKQTKSTESPTSQKKSQKTSNVNKNRILQILKTVYNKDPVDSKKNKIKNQMQDNQYSLIFDEVYKQKHNIFSDKIIKWRQRKDHFLTSSYKKSIEQYFTEMQTENKKFQKRIHQLLKVTNAEYQMLNKIKPINDQKQHPKSKDNIPITHQAILSTQQQQTFQTAIQKSNKKASYLHELCQFSARFFAITSTQLNEFKSLNSQIQNRKQRHLFDYKKQSNEENKIGQELCIKDEAKYFHLKNFQKLKQSLDREIKILSKTHQDARAYYKQSSDKRKQILMDCIDNMAKFEELYIKVFSSNLLEQIKQHFQKLVDEINKNMTYFEQKQQDFQKSKKQIQKQLERLHSDKKRIFHFILQQITLGEWRNMQLQTTKKTSFTSFSSISFTSTQPLRQQTVYESSTHQFQIPPSNSIAGGMENQLGYVMTLTVDYKLIFRKQAERDKIYREFFLHELKVKSDKEKKVTDKRVLILKDKKNKQSIQLTFPDPDKREEFFLHLERFEQHKNTFKK